MFSWFSWFI